MYAETRCIANRRRTNANITKRTMEKPSRVPLASRENALKVLNAPVQVKRKKERVCGGRNTLKERKREERKERKREESPLTRI